MAPVAEAPVRQSPFETVKTKILIHLHPSKLGNILEGVEEQLRLLLFRYVEDLNGVVLSYEDLEFLDRYGDIVYDLPYINFSIQVKFLVFSPSPGLILQALVSRVSPNGVSALVYGCLTAVISEDQIRDKFRWVQAEDAWVRIEDPEVKIQLNSMVAFSVIGSQSKSGLLYMQGSLLDEGTGPLPGPSQIREEQQQPNNHPLDAGSSSHRKRARTDPSANHTGAESESEPPRASQRTGPSTARAPGFESEPEPGASPGPAREGRKQTKRSRGDLSTPTPTPNGTAEGHRSESESEPGPKPGASPGAEREGRQKTKRSRRDPSIPPPTPNGNAEGHQPVTLAASSSRLTSPDSDSDAQPLQPRRKDKHRRDSAAASTLTPTPTPNLDGPGTRPPASERSVAAGKKKTSGGASTSEQGPHVPGVPRSDSDAAAAEPEAPSKERKKKRRAQE